MPPKPSSLVHVLRDRIPAGAHVEAQAAETAADRFLASAAGKLDGETRTRTGDTTTSDRREQHSKPRENACKQVS
jgi:hypothetical protein